MYGNGGNWRLDLPEEVQKRTVKGERAVADLITINLLEVIAMVITAYVHDRHEGRETA